MYSAYKLYKQGDNIQPWCTPFPIWNPTVVPRLLVTVACWLAYGFLRRQVRWSGIPISFRFFPQFVVIHIVQGFGVVNKAEVDVSLEFSSFFCDPAVLGNLISGSSAFSKSSLNICMLYSHVLLKPGLENFERYSTNTWKCVPLCNCLRILWHCLSVGLEWKLTFSSPLATPEFSEFADILSAAL